MLGCRPLTEEEFKLLMRSLETPRDKMLAALLYYTGFRIKEALSLTRQDAMQPRLTVYKRNMKGKVQSRSVAVHPTLATMLRSYTSNLPDGPLFPSRKRSGAITPIQAYRRIKAAVNVLEMQGAVATHSFRKAFANRVFEALGRDLLKTAKALGHKSVVSTMSYLTVAQDEVDEAVTGL